MKKILIPFADHDHLTVAHKRIIEYGQKMGIPKVSVTLCHQEWNMWLRDGKLGYDPATGLTKKEKIPKVNNQQLKEISDLNIEEVQIVYPEYPSEDKRIEIEKVATNFINLYEDQLIVQRYKLLCKSFLMRRWTQTVDMALDVDCILRGPELSSFFYKHIGRLFGWKEMLIMPEMVRDPTTGIRSQYTLERLPFPTLEMASGFRKVFLDVRPFMKVGPNPKLVKELNISYPDIEILDVTAWEGGIVDGRLEVIGFHLPTPNGGSVIVEDIEYEK